MNTTGSAILKQLKQQAIQPAQAKNSFPYKDVYPKDLIEVIEATSECLDYPKPFIAAAMLAAVSVAVGNSRMIETKYRQSAMIWLTLVGMPGTMKSHPLKWALNPITEFVARETARYNAAFDEYERLKNLSEEELKAEGQTEKPKPPVMKKPLVQDFTIERLIELMNSYPRGMMINAKELAGFLKNQNRYSGGSDTERYLEIWDGDELYYDRKNGKPVFIEKPFVSIAGTIQPKVVNELFKDGKSDNGFTHRFLFVAPDNLKKSYENDKELDPSVLSKYRNIINRLIELPLDLSADNESIAPKILRLTTEARAKWVEWKNHNADLYNDSENEYQAGVYSKLELYCQRFALILQMMYYATGEDSDNAISLRAIEGAVKITEYFRHEAMKIYNRVTGNDPLAALSKVQAKFYHELPESFETKEAKAIAAKLAIPARTMEGWLSDKRQQEGDFIKLRLVEKINRGEFQKLAA